MKRDMSFLFSCGAGGSKRWWKLPTARVSSIPGTAVGPSGHFHCTRVFHGRVHFTWAGPPLSAPGPLPHCKPTLQTPECPLKEGSEQSRLQGLVKSNKLPLCGELHVAVNSLLVEGKCQLLLWAH